MKTATEIQLDKDAAEQMLRLHAIYKFIGDAPAEQLAALPKLADILWWIKYEYAPGMKPHDTRAVEIETQLRKAGVL